MQFNNPRDRGDQIEVFRILNDMMKSFRLQNIKCLVMYIHTYYLGVNSTHINNINITSCSLYHNNANILGISSEVDA